MGIIKKDQYTNRGITEPETKQSTIETLKKAVENEATITKADGEVTDVNNYQYNEVKRSLGEFIEAYQKYLEAKDKLDEEKASLQIHTDWSEIFEGKPTVAMKEAYIDEVTIEKRITNRELYLDKLYKEELYKLEVKRFEKDNIGAI